MNFVCAELLGLSHTFQLWGEMINYRDVRNLSIRGRITGHAGAESISGVWTGMAPYFNFTGYEAISINGYNLGTGRLVSVDFEESTDVVSKPYVAQLELLQTGNLWNATGSFYSGFYGSGANTTLGPIFGPEDLYSPKYLNSFKEDSEFSSSKSGEYKYDRSVSASIDKSYTGNSLTLFANITGKLFTQDNNLQIINAIYPSYYTGILTASPITSNSLTYDQINNNYSASQSFIFDSSNPWTWNYRHVLNYGKDGYVSVAENGDIKSSRISGTSNIYYANAGWQSIETGIFNRVSGFYRYYITGQPNNIYSGTCNPLVNFPTQFSLSKNNLIGTINYNKSYTDNPAQNSGYFFSYQNEISAGTDGNVSVSENGRYKGQYADRASGFSAVYSAYQSGIPSIYTRSTGFYTGSLNQLFVCPSGRDLNLIKTDETYREYFQEVNYSYQFTDDRDIVNDDNFYRISAVYSDQKPVLQVGYFNISHDSEIAQRQAQSTLGTFTNKVSIVGRPTTTIATYLSGAATKLVVPDGSEVFLSDLNYSLAKNQNEFNFSSTYTYSDYPEIPDLLV